MDGVVVKLNYPKKKKYLYFDDDDKKSKKFIHDYILYKKKNWYKTNLQNPTKNNYDFAYKIFYTITKKKNIILKNKIKKH